MEGKIDNAMANGKQLIDRDGVENDHASTRQYVLSCWIGYIIDTVNRTKVKHEFFSRIYYSMRFNEQNMCLFKLHNTKIPSKITKNLVWKDLARYDTHPYSAAHSLNVGKLEKSQQCNEGKFLRITYENLSSSWNKVVVWLVFSGTVRRNLNWLFGDNYCFKFGETLYVFAIHHIKGTVDFWNIPYIRAKKTWLLQS